MNTPEQTLQVLAQKAISQQKMIATAESCTGGGIAEAITSLAGSSAWFAGSIVSYSNNFKKQLLGVKEQTLIEHGAVSEQTVREMLAGVLALPDVNLGLSISGIAGPGGGTKDKPVGTVWMAWGDKSCAHTGCFQFDGDRAQVREQAKYQAISLLVDFIQ